MVRKNGTGCRRIGYPGEKMKAAIVIALCILLVIVARWIWRLATRPRAPTWMPLDMAEAKLEFAEKTFETDHPAPLLARIDRAYRYGKTIVLVELKTRKYIRVYRSDVIELSAQKFAMEASTGDAVSEVGLVLVQDPQTGLQTALKVKLLGKEEVLNLIERRRRILALKTPPKYAENESLCHQCEYLVECKPPLKRPRPETH